MRPKLHSQPMHVGCTGPPKRKIACEMVRCEVPDGQAPDSRCMNIPEGGAETRAAVQAVVFAWDVYLHEPRRYAALSLVIGLRNARIADHSDSRIVGSRIRRYDGCHVGECLGPRVLKMLDCIRSICDGKGARGSSGPLRSRVAPGSSCIDGDSMCLCSAALEHDHCKSCACILYIGP